MIRRALLLVVLTLAAVSTATAATIAISGDGIGLQSDRGTCVLDVDDADAASGRLTCVMGR